MPWRRSLAFGLVATSIDATGHVLAERAMIDPLPALLVLVVATLVARLAAGRRHRAVPLAVATIAVQCFSHYVLDAATGASHAAVHQAAVHAHAHEHAHAATQAAGLPPLAMFAFHAVASLLGVLVLLRLERRVWGATVAAARRVARSVGAWFGFVPVAARAPRSIGVAPRVHAGAPGAPLHAAWHALAGVRRGPPCLAAIA